MSVTSPRFPHGFTRPHKWHQNFWYVHTFLLRHSSSLSLPSRSTYGISRVSSRVIRDTNYLPSSGSAPPSVCISFDKHTLPFLTPAVDDPRKIVKVIASDGKSGDTRELAYTNCRIIGNGSFGIVFQAKLLDEQPANSEIAIKKVLQDKRFKVSLFFCCIISIPQLLPPLWPLQWFLLKIIVIDICSLHFSSFAFRIEP